MEKKDILPKVRNCKVLPAAFVRQTKKMIFKIRNGEEKMARQINFEDRKRIARLWSIGTPIKIIAEQTGVCQTTISRELRRGYPGRNGANQKPAYDPAVAQKAINAGNERRGRKKKEG